MDNYFTPINDEDLWEFIEQFKCSYDFVIEMKEKDPGSTSANIGTPTEVCAHIFNFFM